MIDIVIPNKNEKKFIKMAETLGYTQLVLMYPLKQYEKAQLQLKELQKETAIKLSLATLLDTKELQKKQKGMCFIKDSEKTRFAIESKRIDSVIELENKLRDFVHHRNSGLNEVLCTLLKEKQVSISYSFSLILEKKGSHRAQILGRMMQNISFARKFKFKQIIASFATDPYNMRSSKDLQSLFIVLGMTESEAKQAMSWK